LFEKWVAFCFKLDKSGSDFQTENFKVFSTTKKLKFDLMNIIKLIFFSLEIKVGCKKWVTLILKLHKIFKQKTKSQIILC